MGEQKISSLVTGGGASAGPPLGPALGPLGVNIMEVINAINDKTSFRAQPLASPRSREIRRAIGQPE